MSHSSLCSWLYNVRTFHLWGITLWAWKIMLDNNTYRGHLSFFLIVVNKFHETCTTTWLTKTPIWSIRTTMSMITSELSFLSLQRNHLVFPLGGYGTTCLLVHQASTQKWKPCLDFYMGLTKIQLHEYRVWHSGNAPLGLTLQ